MPGPIIQNPIPDWLHAQNASVTDSSLTKALRMIGHLIGADNPTTQVIGLMATDLPGEAPTGGLAKAVGDLWERAKSITAYHGTRSSSLMTGGLKASTGGEFGPGVYLTKDPGTAEFYATHVAQGPDGPTIMPVNVELKNPFRVDKTDWIKMTERSTPSQVQRRLIAKGHDGIIGVGLTGQEQIVAFSPDQVQSTFDILKKYGIVLPAAAAASQMGPEKP